ncbi:MAG: rhamnogalacturonan acetylesterase [Oscillospiraceae bacterium]|jgi:lysophospholipase L1-like esterase|nr:rhamnogalacturonan acetylesterase [Oscillospiraceae bacterium]
MVIHVVGDSTADTGSEPFFGWAGQLEQYLPDGFTVRNAAISGRSSRSFIEEGRFDAVREAMRGNDVLLIQFGHNDEKDDERHTDPQTTFKQYLTRYIEAARQANAVPILLTPVSRNHWLDDNTLMYTHGEYPRAVRDLATEQNVALIDAKVITRKLIQSLGKDGSEELFVHTKSGEYDSLPDGWHDKTHFNLHGARTVAKLIADELPRILE